jgi:hypothetical protein
MLRLRSCINRITLLSRHGVEPWAAPDKSPDYVLADLHDFRGSNSYYPFALMCIQDWAANPPALLH